MSKFRTGLDEKRNSDSIAGLGEVGVDVYTKRRMKTEYNGESNAFVLFPWASIGLLLSWVNRSSATWRRRDRTALV